MTLYGLASDISTMQFSRHCRVYTVRLPLLPIFLLFFILSSCASAAPTDDPTYGHWPLPSCPPRSDGSRMESALTKKGKDRAVRLARTLAPESGGIKLLRQLAIVGRAMAPAVKKSEGQTQEANAADPYAAALRALCWIVYDDPAHIDVPEPPKPPTKKGAVTPQLSSRHRRAIERYTLAALYYSTSGPATWVKKDGWLGASDICSGSWMGVSCSGGYVSAISLPFNNLDGRLPEEFWRLSRLSEIYLYGNSIKGPLPPAIKNLSKTLTVVQLHMNEFTGRIPKGFGSLVNLREASLYGNNFEGTLPAEIGNLKNLQILDIFATFVTGSLPSTMEKMSSLKEVYLDETLLTGSIVRFQKGGICDLKYLKVLKADCLDVSGWPAEVNCDCCTVCCNDMSNPRCLRMENGKAAKTNVD